MKIISFKAENIKKLKVVEITPKGNIVRITGKNEAGKSSVLDAIEMALVGKKAAGRGVLRKTTEKGRVKLDLGDFTIVRSFTDGNNYLKVETKDGFERKSPQKFLDDIVGAVSFDPMTFINADPKKQRQLLLDFSGIELGKMDDERKTLYDSRTIESRYLKDAEARLRGLTRNDDAPAKPIVVSELVKDLEKIKKYNSRKIDLENDLARLEDERNDMAGEMGELERRIKRLREELTEAENEAVSKIETAKNIKKSVEKAKTAVENFKAKPEKPIRDQITNAEAINEMVRDNERHIEVEKEVSTHKGKVDKLTRDINAIDAKKTETVENSKLPIKGLSFSEDAVLYKGVELEQIAKSEKIRVGLAISMALNPKLKVLRITDGSLLDSKSWKDVEALVKKNDYQVWVEQVDESGKVGFYLEDGSLKD
jgi:DNA repair exonuclease SbcCD ATPase subunit